MLSYNKSVFTELFIILNNIHLLSVCVIQIFHRKIKFGRIMYNIWTMFAEDETIK